MDIVHWEKRPILRSPVMIVAFEGWNDAGDAASAAATYLARVWGARPFATIDPEEFYDFTTTRPQIRLDDDMTRVVDWPTNRFTAAPMAEWGRDVIFLQGVEPQLRWRTFCSAVVGVANTLGVEMVVTLGALLAEVPHTRPVRVTGTAGDARLVDRLGLLPSGYEGPTGIVGVLSDALRRSGIASASLWATVPHYVGQTPSPKAALALVERAAQLLEVPVRTPDLDVAAAAYERSVSEVVDADDDATAYVRSLEEADDDSDDSDNTDDDDDNRVPLEAAGGEVLAAEVERYLRERGPHG